MQSVKKFSLFYILLLLIPLVPVLGINLFLPPSIIAISLFVALYYNDIKITKQVSYGDFSFLLLFIYNIITLSFFLFNPSNFNLLLIPISVIIVFFPMMFFLIGRCFKLNDINVVYKVILLSNFTQLSIGILFYLYQPEFYTNYLRDSLFESGATEHWQLYYRFQGVLGSTSCGVLAVLSLALLKSANFQSIVKTILGIFFVIVSLLTFQRSAIALSLMLFMLIIIDELRTRLVLGTILLIPFIYLIYVWDSYLDLSIYTQRAAEIVDVIDLSDRPSYQIAFDIISHELIGVGPGAASSIAETYSVAPYGQIVDANHMRIMVESGFLGLFLFLVVAIQAIIFSYKTKQFIPIGLIVLCYNLQALGTNVFDSYLTGYLYWFFIGILYINVNPKSKFNFTHH